MDLTKYCTAARVETSLASASRQVLMFGRATAPRGFRRLQEPPLNMTPYQSARLLHYCVDHRSEEKPSELLSTLCAYAKTGDESAGEEGATLAALVRRVGVDEDHVVRGLVHAFTWSKASAEELLYLATGKLPYPSLARAVEAEAAHVRRVA